MTEEKDHEHHPHEKKDEKYNFQISKVRIWQGVSAILAILVVFLWYNPDFGKQETAQIPQPTGAAPSPTPQLPTKQDIDLDDDPVLGNKNAPVTIVSFEDYQCPYCGRAFEQTFPLIKKDYIDTGKVKYVYRDYPLPFHSEAQPAAEAAECADEQGKFWKYHDAIFQNQESLSSSLYIKLAEELGLDANKFKTCIETGKYKQEVQDDFSYGSSIGVGGTPTFFVIGAKNNANVDTLKQLHDGINLFYQESLDGKNVVFMMVGALPYQAFKQIIDAELSNQ